MGNYPILFTLIIVLNASFVLTYYQKEEPGAKCSGYCTKEPHKCVSRGGRIIGLCSNSLSCCNPLVRSTISCGAITAGQRLIHFKSAGYPSILSGDLTCEAKIKIQSDTVSIRVDFVHVEMDGQSFRDVEDSSGSCESDMIFLKGFGSWMPPPRCGNLSGYSFLIDKESPQVKDMHTLSIISLMSSQSYRWHIKVLQTPKRKYPSEPNSIEEYEIPFKEKRSLLTPVFRSYDDEDDKIDKDNARHSIDDNDNVSESRITYVTEKVKDSIYSPSSKWESLDDLTPAMIVNGEASVITAVPWQVSIRLKPDSTTPKTSLNSSEERKNCSISEGFHICGGSILNDRFILSAAHCFYGTSKTSGMVNISTIKAVVGDTNICTDDSTSSGSTLLSFDYDIESITLHYAYDGQLILNDIAILRVKNRIKTFDHIKPIRMAKQGEDYTNKEAFVSGWGDAFLGNENDTENYLEELEAPDVLQIGKKFLIQNQTYCTKRELDLQYIDPEKEIKKHMKYLLVFNSTLCTLSKINGTEDRLLHVGNGDSGGPMVVFSNSTSTGGIELPILVGIVSYGVSEDSKSCSKEKDDNVNNTIEYFTSIPFYRNWIDLTVASFDNVT